MKKEKGTWLIVFLCLMLVVITTACNGNKESNESSAMVDGHKPVTITIVHEHSAEAAGNISSSAGFRAMLDKYIDEHPWVDVEETLVANSEISQKYLTLIAADELPDVSYVSYPWLDAMAGNEMLVDLTEYVDSNDYIDLFSMTYDGRIYGMPNKFSGYNLVYYNKQMFEDIGFDEFPSTMEEFLEAGEQFQKQDIDMISFGNMGKWFAVSYLISPLLYNHCGTEWVDSMMKYTGENSWTDPCFINAMKDIVSLRSYINADCNMQNDMWAAGWYMQGKCAAHLAGTWGMGILEKLGDDYPEVWENTRVALLPSSNGAENTLCTAVGVGVGVSSKTEGDVFDAALELCQQISSKDYAKMLAEMASPTPIIIDLDFSDRGVQYVNFSDILNNTEHTGLNFNDYFPQNIVTNMQVLTQNLLAGSMTPEESAKLMQSVQDSL